MTVIHSNNESYNQNYALIFNAEYEKIETFLDEYDEKISEYAISEESLESEWEKVKHAASIFPKGRWFSFIVDLRENEIISDRHQLGTEVIFGEKLTYRLFCELIHPGYFFLFVLVGHAAYLLAKTLSATKDQKIVPESSYSITFPMATQFEYTDNKRYVTEYRFVSQTARQIIVDSSGNVILHRNSYYIHPGRYSFSDSGLFVSPPQIEVWGTDKDELALNTKIYKIAGDILKNYIKSAIVDGYRKKHSLSEAERYGTIVLLYLEKEIEGLKRSEAGYRAEEMGHLLNTETGTIYWTVYVVKYWRKILLQLVKQWIPLLNENGSGWRFSTAKDFVLFIIRLGLW